MSDRNHGGDMERDRRKILEGFFDKPDKTVKRLHRAFDPMCAFYLARALPGNQAGLEPGSLHHIAGMNWMAEMVELIDPNTQEPPVYVAQFSDIEVVARNDNPEQPGKLVTGS